MKISRADDGKTVIQLDSWEEIGLRIVLPRPKARIQPEEISFNLQKVPVEVVITPETEGGENDGMVFAAEVEPEYCEHGVLNGVSVSVSNWNASVDVSFLTYPVELPGDHEDGEDEEGDE